MRIVHFFNSYHGLGGVEAVLKRHHRGDHLVGIDSRFIIYFEDNSEPVERVHFLGLTGRSTIRQTRNRVTSALADFTPDAAMYHGLWGMHQFGGLDKSSRRVVALHGVSPEREQALLASGRFFDGFICIGEPVRTIARACLPKLAPERFVVLPVPISPIGTALATNVAKDRPLVIGFCGRLVVPDKRVDQLPEVCRCLDEQNIKYRAEFLGEGPQKPWLENQLPDRSKFIFHGRKSGEDYWQIIKGWDAILFVSDTEGTPVSLLEALSMGVIPIFPKIGSGVDAMVQKLDPALLYEPGTSAEIVRAVRLIQNLNSKELTEVRSRCQASVAAHLGDNYLKSFASFMAQILRLPPVATPRLPRYPWPISDLSFTWLERLSLLRRKLSRPR